MRRIRKWRKRTWRRKKRSSYLFCWIDSYGFLNVLKCRLLEMREGTKIYIVMKSELAISPEGEKFASCGVRKLELKRSFTPLRMMDTDN